MPEAEDQPINVSLPEGYKISPDKRPNYKFRPFERFADISMPSSVDDTCTPTIVKLPGYGPELRSRIEGAVRGETGIWDGGRTRHQGVPPEPSFDALIAVQSRLSPPSDSYRPRHARN